LTPLVERIVDLRQLRIELLGDGDVLREILLRGMEGLVELLKGLIGCTGRLIERLEPALLLSHGLLKGRAKLPHLGRELGDLLGKLLELLRRLLQPLLPARCVDAQMPNNIANLCFHFQPFYARLMCYTFSVRLGYAARKTRFRRVAVHRNRPNYGGWNHV
jgi:hypothetical protein